MKTALKVISLFVFGLIAIGLFTREIDNFLKNLLPLGLLLAVFVWMPFFLFYRYDSGKMGRGLDIFPQEDNPKHKNHRDEEE